MERIKELSKEIDDLLNKAARESRESKDKGNVFAPELRSKAIELIEKLAQMSPEAYQNLEKELGDWDKCIHFVAFAFRDETTIEIADAMCKMLIKKDDVESAVSFCQVLGMMLFSKNAFSLALQLFEGGAFICEKVKEADEQYAIWKNDLDRWALCCEICIEVKVEESGVQPLIKLLEGADDASRRAAAARSLGELHAHTATVSLIGGLKDPEPEVRRAALEALGKIGDKGAILSIIECLYDEDLLVRSRAILALEELKDKIAITALKQACAYAQLNLSYGDKDLEISIRDAIREILGDGRTLMDTICELEQGEETILSCRSHYKSSVERGVFLLEKSLSLGGVIGESDHGNLFLTNRRLIFASADTQADRCWDLPLECITDVSIVGLMSKKLEVRVKEGLLHRYGLSFEFSVENPFLWQDKVASSIKAKIQKEIVGVSVPEVPFQENRTEIVKIELEEIADLLDKHYQSEESENKEHIALVLKSKTNECVEELMKMSQKEFEQINEETHTRIISVLELVASGFVDEIAVEIADAASKMLVEKNNDEAAVRFRQVVGRLLFAKSAFSTALELFNGAALACEFMKQVDKQYAFWKDDLMLWAMCCQICIDQKVKERGTQSLIGLLDIEEGFKRAAIAKSLGALRVCEARSPLAKCLKDPEIRVRREAVEALGEIGDKTVVPSIIDCLYDEDLRVRVNAAHALRKLGDRSSITALTQARDHAEIEGDTALTNVIEDAIQKLTAEEGAPTQATTPKLILEQAEEAIQSSRASYTTFTEDLFLYPTHDFGYIYLTNRRLIFSSADKKYRRHWNLPLEGITEVSVAGILRKKLDVNVKKNFFGPFTMLFEFSVENPLQWKDKITSLKTRIENTEKDKTEGKED